MKHTASGTIAFIGVLALAGCYSYTGEAINNSNYNTVQATPTFVKVKVGDSTEVIARLVNDNNNGAITSYTIGGGGAGILVHNNANYRPVFDSKLDTLVQSGDKTAQQYFVVGTAVGRYTFTLTPTAVNTGISVTVPVVVTPLNLGAALSRTTAAAGDTVVVTAIAGTVFSQTSAISFAAGAAPAIVARAADSSTITFLAAPGDVGVLTVTKVGVKAVPSIVPVTLATTNAFTAAVPSPTVAPTTLSATTGLIGVPVTVTLGGGLRFIGSTHVLIGGIDAGIQSVSADSSTAVVMPMAASNGAVTYTNLVLSFLNTVPLPLPSDGKTFTVGAAFGGTTDPAAAVFATAPAITLRPQGSVMVTGGTVPSTNASECGGGTGDGCAVYKVVLTGSTTYDINLVWQGASDMGLYRFKVAGSGAVSGGSGFTGNCDNGGQGASGQPEVCTVTGLAAGTYFFGVEFFGTGSGYSAGANTVPPTWFQFRVTTH